MRIIAWDSETFQIGPGAVAPRIVCISRAVRLIGDVETDLIAQGDAGKDGGLWLFGCMRDMLVEAAGGTVRLVTHNGGFDYACVCATWPELIPLVFEALHSGNCTDTLWREKLLNLSTTGRLDGVELPDGSEMRIEYSLVALEKAYLGRDRSAEKDDQEDHWRLHFGLLDGLTAAEILDTAPDAHQYAMADAEGTLLVYEAQEARKREWTIASTKTEEFQLLSSFCLYLETAWGMATNPAAVAAMRVQVERVLLQNRDLLVASGVLRGGIGRVPHKREMDRACEACREILRQDGAGTREVDDLHYRPDEFDWTPYAPRLRELGIKFKAPVEESINTGRLQEVAGAVYQRLGAIPTMTAGGATQPKIKLGDEETEFLAAHDPIITQYHVRKSLQKLVTNQFPILESAPVVHFKYDALKETTRTSSMGNAKGKPASYPAANGQQVPKAIEGGDLNIDPRRGYAPRPGTVFFDVDLHCLELACVGQITHDLFGESVHLERYNAGYDLHAYLGSQILIRSTVDGAAAEVRQSLEANPTPELQYRAFGGFKKCGDLALEKVYKTYRNLAKPIGLGFPGGIGPAKMTTLARTQYGVTLTEEEAHGLREMWRDVYPEMRWYFKWVESQRDYHNTSEDGELYWYETPMGAVRRGCTFCSIANGKAMQSPGAEAAKAGNNAVVRACYDITRAAEWPIGTLYGCRPIAFVHDQVIGETTRDMSLWHEQAMAVSALMIEAAKVALPKVNMRTEPLLTTVWSKSAEPVLDEDGRLVPWQPTKETK